MLGAAGLRARTRPRAARQLVRAGVAPLALVVRARVRAGRVPAVPEVEGRLGRIAGALAAVE